MKNKKDLTLIVQIPCLNEEAVLPQTIKDIPRSIPGISRVELLVIDDGSTDNTVEVAKKCGVDHIVQFTNNKGLARAFDAGLEECLRLGADIIVNTDADNQYRGDDIPVLIQPILDGKSDMVVGTRNIREHKEFSLIKKQLQKLGSWVVCKLSGTKLKDTTSGFRAYNVHAAVRMNVMTNYSYTLETIIQAGRIGIAIGQVPIRVNPKTRESRLFRSMWQYIKRSISTLLRVYTVYRPLTVFFSLGSVIFLAGFALGCRFLYFYLTGNGAGKIQSLILSATLIMLGSQILVIGLLANLISANKFLMEKVLVKIKEKELEQ